MKERIVSILTPRHSSRCGRFLLAALFLLVICVVLAVPGAQAAQAVPDVHAVDRTASRRVSDESRIPDRPLYCLSCRIILSTLILEVKNEKEVAFCAARTYIFSAFCIPSYASNDNESSFTVRCIDHEDFESALSEHDVCLITPTASPRVSPCCDAMRVVWIKTEEWHLVEQGGSICLSVCYLGYRGCSNCK